MTKWLCLLFALLVAVPAFADSDTVYPPACGSNSVPNAAGCASFGPSLYTFLANEDAARWLEQGGGNFVSILAQANACLGTTGAGLTMTPVACVAYNGGWRSTETGSITFPNSSTCFVAMDDNITGSNGGLPNFGRVAGTHYLTDCIDVVTPTMPANAQLLMKVLTSGGSITAVTDLRLTAAAFSGGGGFTGVVTDGTVQGNGLPGTPLSIALTPLNALAVATGSYSMNDNQLNLVAPGLVGSVTDGDAAALGQGGAFFNDLGNTSINRAINPMAQRALVAGTSSTFLTMGALNNAAHDDTVAIDNAILAAEGMATPSSSITNVGKQRVYLPASPAGNCYFITQPIRLLGPNIEFGGDGNYQPNFCENYIGFAVDDEGWGANNLTYTTGLVGGGHAIASASNSNTIAPSDVMMSALHNLSNDAAFDISGEINITSLANGVVWSYQAGVPMANAMLDGNHQIVAEYQVNSSHQVFCRITTTGSGLVSATGSDTGFSFSANHFWRFDYDGTNLRCYRDGTLVVGPSAATGTLYTSVNSGSGTQNVSQQPDSGNAPCYPYGDCFGNNTISGTFDIFDAENQSCQTAGNCTTVPSAKVTTGPHTIIAINYESTCSGEGTNTGCSLDGFQLAHTGLANDGSGTERVYLKVYGSASGTYGTPFQHVHDINLCASGGPGGYGWANGLYVIGANNSEFNNLKCGQFSKTAFDLNASFETKFHDNLAGNTVGGTGLCFRYGPHYGESKNSGNYCDSAAVMGWHEGDEWTEDDFNTFASRGYGVVQSVYDQTSFVNNNEFNDLESTDSTWVANDFMNQSAGSFKGWQPNTRNAAPYVYEIGDAQQGITYDTPLFTTFGTTTPPAELISHLSGQSLGTNNTPNGPDVIINQQPVCEISGVVSGCFNNNGTPVTNAVEVPLSNPAGWVRDIGDSMSGERCAQYAVAGGSAGTYLNAPNCNAGSTGSSILAEDCAACTSGTSCASGGSSGHPCMAQCNGTNWIETGVGFCM